MTPEISSDCRASQVLPADQGEWLPMQPILAPSRRMGVLPAQGLALHTGYFLEEEPVCIRACGPADIDIYVYDRFGILVAYDNAEGGMPRCTLKPVRSGEFTIKLVNNSLQPVEYELDLA
ncbi:MAG TPA: hypothetical protein VKU00_11210 [Chthonomonadaceae bacterium]|nr:hypothetical protein [Chthonomonadaceae bacterium]